MGAHFKLKYVMHELLANESKYMRCFPYSNVVCSIMYAMIGFRLDIAYVISIMSRFMSNPAK